MSQALFAVIWAAPEHKNTASWSLPGLLVTEPGRDEQPQRLVRWGDTSGHAAVEHEVVLLDAVAEDDSVLGHVRDDLERLGAGDRADDDVGAGDLTDERLT